MFKIGDFSRLGQVSVRMLRHYDKLGLLTPSHTDQFTGYRYYTVDQLARLHRIVALNGIGLTLEQVGKLLRKDGDLPPDRLRGMLMVRQAQLEQELRTTQSQLMGVAARLQQLEQEGRPSPYEIVVKEIEPLALVGVRTVVPQIAEMNAYCAALYGQLYAALDQYDIAPRGPELTIYHTEEYVETDLTVETAVAVDPAMLRRPPPDERLLLHEIPAEPQVAALIYQGSYSGITPAVLALLTWVGQHQHCPIGPLRELHLSGPAHQNGKLVEPATLELQLPIKPLG